MQKALIEMNLQLHRVVADITGATGLRIIRAILAGASSAIEPRDHLSGARRGRHADSAEGSLRRC